MFHKMASRVSILTDGRIRSGGDPLGLVHLPVRGGGRVNQAPALIGYELDIPDICSAHRIFISIAKLLSLGP